MTRAEYRRASVLARAALLYGGCLSPFEQQVAVALLRVWRQVDVLACRQSSFAADARTRITLYPL